MLSVSEEEAHLLLARVAMSLIDPVGNP
jgi:hypothetical protein